MAGGCIAGAIINLLYMIGNSIKKSVQENNENMLKYKTQYSLIERKQSAFKGEIIDSLDNSSLSNYCDKYVRVQGKLHYKNDTCIYLSSKEDNKTFKLGIQSFDEVEKFSKYVKKPMYIYGTLVLLENSTYFLKETSLLPREVNIEETKSRVKEIQTGQEDKKHTYELSGLKITENENPCNDSNSEDYNETFIVDGVAPIIVSDSQIKCPKCDVLQNNDRSFCWRCGSNFIK